jgi:hypothetical protein
MRYNQQLPAYIVQATNQNVAANKTPRKIKSVTVLLNAILTSHAVAYIMWQL